MKLRISGNSVRLRLGPGEVAKLAEAGSIVESTVFNDVDQRLVYELRAAPVVEMSASFTGGRLTVLLPQEMARQWASTELVSLSNASEGASQPRLKILIEKDFECTDPTQRAEQGEAYPNPRVPKH